MRRRGGLWRRDVLEAQHQGNHQKGQQAQQQIDVGRRQDKGLFMQGRGHLGSPGQMRPASVEQARIIQQRVRVEAFTQDRELLTPALPIKVPKTRSALMVPDT